MFGSIYIGLSGLNAYSQGLKAVSNNVSNLNSAGFKAADISFSDIYGGGSAGGLNYGAGYRAQGHGVSFDDVTINFSQGELRQTGRDLDLVALDQALERLAASEPRLAQVVELHFYAGLEFAEIAQLMQLSERTVARDWRAARALLHLSLAEAPEDRDG